MEIDNGIDASEKPQNRIKTRMLEMNGYCSLTEIKRDGKQIRVLSGKHSSREAVRLIHEVIRPEIKRTNDWIFLIEAGEAVDIVDNKEILGETYVAVQLARENKIPVRDPIVNPYDLGVIELYAKNNNDPDTSYERIIGSLAFQAMKDMGSDKVENVAEPIGAIYDMSADRLVYCLGEAISKIKGNPAEQFWKWEKNLRKGLLDVSNVVSVQALDYYLRMLNVNNVLLYCGASHKSMLDIERSQIPPSLKLSDKEIEYITNERLTRFRRTQKRLDKWLSCKSDTTSSNGV